MDKYSLVTPEQFDIFESPGLGGPSHGHFADIIDTLQLASRFSQTALQTSIYLAMPQAAANLSKKKHTHTHRDS
jgi:hypothetical protein